MKNKGRAGYEYRCSFCGKDQDQVQRLIAGPKAVYVCDECAFSFKNHPSSKEDRQPQKLACSFCGKDQQQIEHITAGPKGVNICSECVDLCIEIITEEGKGQKVF